MGIEYRCDRCKEYFPSRKSVFEFEATFSSSYLGDKECTGLLCIACTSKMKQSIEQILEGE